MGRRMGGCRHFVSEHKSATVGNILKILGRINQTKIKLGSIRAQPDHGSMDIFIEYCRKLL